MKKRLILELAFVFLIIGVLSVGGVWAAGMNDETNPQKNKCIQRTGYEQYFNPVGCHCVKGGANDFMYSPVILKWARSNWDAGISIGHSDESRGDDGNRSEYYCYVDDPLSKIKPGSGNAGSGEARMCTEDDYTKYYDTSVIPASSSGQKGNKECRRLLPYCEDNKCNQCLENEDCMRYAPSQGVTAKCIEKEYYDKTKACGYCVNLIGSGDIKITFVTRGLNEQEVRGVMDSIISVEPFKYLNDRGNKFTFNWVYLPSGINSFVKLDYDIKDVEGCEQKYTDVRLSMKSMQDISGLSSDICGSSDVMIFIDKKWPIVSTGLYTVGYARGSPFFIRFVLTDETAIFERYSSNNIVYVHELGHALCNLKDEYLPNYPIDGVNIDKKDDKGQCNTFYNYGLSKTDCFILDPGCKINPSKSAYRASSTKSVMRGGSSSNSVSYFNIVSCASCLKEIGDVGDIKQAVRYCKDTPMPEGYRIFDGVYRYSL